MLDDANEVIQERGDQVRRNMTSVDREVTLPALVRGLVELTAAGAVLSDEIRLSLTPPT